MTKYTEEAALSAMRRRAVDSQFSHLWSDALFAREQARDRVKNKMRVESNIASVRQQQVENVELHVSRYEAELQQITWDLGSYVRWTIVTGWMTFERAAVDATELPKVSSNMYENLPKAIAPNTDAAVFWARPPWPDVRKVQLERNKLIHKNLGSSDLFAGIQLAEEAIIALRSGIKVVFTTLSKDPPLWVECDEVPRRLGGSSAALSVSRAGADEDPQRFRVVWVHGGRETLDTVLRSDDDPWPVVERIASGIRIPIEAIRIYKGDALWRELAVKMRGS
ncbi:MAG: hypothetical protein P9F75_16080 [Candidatus Contendobacter sp.]|nr:hypothetical protein [Candidatus Contendobacter sp.]